jgi:hypothetical protein
MAPRYKKNDPVKQTTPLNQKLIDNYNAGYRSRKEIKNRVERGLSNKPSEEEKETYSKLVNILEEIDAGK